MYNLWIIHNVFEIGHRTLLGLLDQTSDLFFVDKYLIQILKQLLI